MSVVASCYISGWFIAKQKLAETPRKSSAKALAMIQYTFPCHSHSPYPEASARGEHLGVPRNAFCFLASKPVLKLNPTPGMVFPSLFYLRTPFLAFCAYWNSAHPLRRLQGAYFPVVGGQIGNSLPLKLFTWYC